VAGPGGVAAISCSNVEMQVMRLLIVRPPGPLGEALLAALAPLSQRWPTTLVTPYDGLPPLDEVAVVVALFDGTPVSSLEAAALAHFVERGGGLVALGRLDHPALRWLGTGEDVPATPRCELVLRPTPGHPLTARLEDPIVLADRCSLLPGLASPGEELLTLSWQFQRYPVAVRRRHGAGQVVVVALHGAATTLANPSLRRLLLRAARSCAGEHALPPLGVALIGWGAIGSDHATAVQETAGLELVAICDQNPARLAEAQQAFPASRGYQTVEQVLADPHIDVAIVATPPNTHAPLTHRLLEAGKHVVVEKPFCLTTAEADRLIALAAAQGRVLTVYQNRRWDADFLAIRRVVEQGEVGEVFYIETFVGGFEHPCALWHSHAPISGGLSYDWGSHYLDWILTLVPVPVQSVAASEQKRVWFDVTNADMARVLLRFRNGAEAEFIHSEIAAALKPKWYLLGTRGAVVAEWRHEVLTRRGPGGILVEERLLPTDVPATVVVYRRTSDGALHVERVQLPVPPRWPFHVNLADHLADGEPLAVPATAARRTIAVLEAASRSAVRGGAPVPLDDQVG
jgi:predicted dehydrogenase